MEKRKLDKNTLTRIAQYRLKQYLCAQNIHDQLQQQTYSFQQLSRLFQQRKETAEWSSTYLEFSEPFSVSVSFPRRNPVQSAGSFFAVCAVETQFFPHALRLPFAFKTFPRPRPFFSPPSSSLGRVESLYSRDKLPACIHLQRAKTEWWSFEGKSYVWDCVKAFSPFIAVNYCDCSLKFWTF